ncbi:MAG TPA: hypothetical protein VFD84_05635 [Candidatus Binatia bacterium]|jgi:hypothetical protein|nr:hypothetical protein [Candidatus Binatia bacterium]
MRVSAASSGVQLLARADALLQRSAKTFRRASGTPPDDGAPDPSADLPGAIVDVVEARVQARLGALLLRTDDAAGRSVLDILA